VIFAIFYTARFCISGGISDVRRKKNTEPGLLRINDCLMIGFRHSDTKLYISTAFGTSST